MKKTIIKYAPLSITIITSLLIRGFFGGLLLGIAVTIIVFMMLGSKAIKNMERRNNAAMQSLARISAALKD